MLINDLEASHTNMDEYNIYSSYNIIVKSEIIEEQNQKLEDEKKALQSQLEKQIELSGNVLCCAIQ